MKERMLSRSRIGSMPSLRWPALSGSRATVSKTRAPSDSSRLVPMRTRMRERIRSRMPCAV